MSAISRAPAATKLAGNQSASNEKSLFEQQRDAIVGEIAVVCSALFHSICSNLHPWSKLGRSCLHARGIRNMASDLA